MDKAANVCYDKITKLSTDLLFIRFIDLSGTATTKAIPEFACNFNTFHVIGTFPTFRSPGI